MNYEFGLEEIKLEDWKGVPKEERAEYRALYYHYCKKCGKPLPQSRVWSLCKDCQAEEDAKYQPERERARANRHKKYCKQKYREGKDAS